MGFWRCRAAYLLRPVLAVSLGGGSYAQTSSPPSVDSALYPGAKSSPVRYSAASIPAVAAGLPSPAPVALAAPDESAIRVANRFGQVPLGYGRDVAGPAIGAGVWEALPGGGSVWRVALRSPGARAVRIRFSRFSAGTGHVWVYSPVLGDSAGIAPYSGEGPYHDGEFWSETVPGDAVVVEYQPAGVSASGPPPFQIAELAHLWAGPDIGPPEVASCHLDYKCSPQWAQPGQSVAHIVFRKDADQRFYACSGALLNTRGNSFRPYFLTANHCVASDAEARSLQAYWFYESAQCNGAAPGRASATRVDGARLLATAGISAGDYSLLLLEGLPSSPVVFAGWTVTEPTLGAGVTGIHHPDASYKRISFGNRIADHPAIVAGEFAPANQYFRVRETQGRTESGSSGSPLFDSGARVVGVLSHGLPPPPGQTVCDLTEPESGYGRFSVIYPAIERFLNDESQVGFTLTPRTLDFRGANGIFAPPVRQSFRIETTSAASAPFTVTSSAAWIRLSRASGSVSASAPAAIEVSLDEAAVRSPGSYTATLSVQVGTSAPQAVSVRVDMSATRSLVVAAVSPDPVYEQDPDAEGFRWFYQLRLEEKAGIETRLTQLRLDGTDYSSSIASWFGADRLSPLGALSANLRSRGLAVPLDRVFEFAGVDVGSGQPWSMRMTVRFLGRRTQALLRLSAQPELVSQDLTSATCPWRHDIVLAEEAGIGVDLNEWRAGVHDLSSQIAQWFGARLLAPRGRLVAAMCWNDLRVPATLDFVAGGVDDNGNPVRAAAQARFVGPPQAGAALRVTPGRVALESALERPEPFLTAIRVDLRTQRLSWSARLEFPGAARNWLTAFPLSGAGSADITLSASAAGLAQGVYSATLVVEAPQALPPRIDVPVQLAVGVAGSTRPLFSTASVVNAASSVAQLAPGMLFTVYGQNLALSTELAAAVPMPRELGGATVRVNGILCPLHFVSPGQINAQLPYEVRPGLATVSVNVQGAEYSQPIEVRALAPGVFTRDGVLLTPFPEGRPGDVLLAFATGIGAVRPPVPTGDAPPEGAPIANLPVPLNEIRVFLGGSQADVLFAGIPPGLVGVLQINWRIPPDTPTGILPLVVRAGSTVAKSVLVRIRP